MEEQKDRFFSAPSPTPIPTRTPTTTRQPIKSQSQFNTYPLWKHQLREKCLKRVREDRTRLLWKLRSPASKSPSDKELIDTAFRDIVSDELRKIEHSLLGAPSKIKSLYSEVDDTLWEYEGLHNAYEGECEEMLLEMQKIFYEDLSAAPTERENYVETWEDEEDEYLARAVLEHMQLNDEQGTTTWCPICQQGELKEDNQYITCNLCQIKLSMSGEVNLDILRSRLAETHMEHLDRGCKSKPKFCVESRFGLTALYISCKDCLIFEVVM